MRMRMSRFPQRRLTHRPPQFSFVPETILKARKAREELKTAVIAARKEEKAAGKLRRAGELKRAESYLKGASGARGARTGGGGPR